MSDWPKPSKRYGEYIRRIKACGHWAYDGDVRDDRAIIVHTSGATLAYGLHDGGNDQNSARNFAADAQRICGCRFLESRGRKKSRKAFRPSGFSVANTYSNPTQATVDDLNAEWRRLDAQLAALEALGETASRSQVNDALGLIRRRTAVEEKLADLHQPAPTR